MGVMGLVEHWTTLGFPIPRKGTKSFQNDMSTVHDYLEGKFFYEEESRNSRIEIFKTSAERFAEAAFNPKVFPYDVKFKKSLKKYTIGKFIFNPFSPNGTKSMLVTYYEKTLNRRKDQPSLISDQFPTITAKLRKIYQQITLGPTGKITDYDENNLRKTSVLLHRFLVENKKHFLDPSFSIVDLLEYVKQATEKVFESHPQKPSSAWFKSELFLSKTLPTFLHSNAITKDVEQFSIYSKGGLGYEMEH